MIVVRNGECKTTASVPTRCTHHRTKQLRDAVRPRKPRPTTLHNLRSLTILLTNLHTSYNTPQYTSHSVSPPPPQRMATDRERQMGHSGIEAAEEAGTDRLNSHSRRHRGEPGFGLTAGSPPSCSDRETRQRRSSMACPNRGQVVARSSAAHL